MFGTFALRFRISQHEPDPTPDNGASINTKRPAVGWRSNQQAKS